MNIAKILFAIFIPLAFTSCQKDIFNNIPSPPTSYKVKTYTEDVTIGSTHSVVTYNLSYDANGKLISVISTSNPGDKFVFQYSNSSYSMDLYSSNILSIHEEFYLNSNSFVDSTFQYNDTHDSTTEKYLFNGSNQLIILKIYVYSIATGSVLSNTENYEYDGYGNVIKITDNNSVTTNDYYTNLVNNIDIFNPLFVAGKNLIKTTTSDLGGTTVIINHTYTFDSSNRLITDKAVADSGEILIKSYTYY
jgi:hypothetical protein